MKFTHSLFDLQQPVSRQQAVAWHTIGGWVGNIVVMVQGLLLIPLYLHYLGSELYGYWLATGGMLAWLAMVDIGGTAITRQRCAHAYGKGDLQRMVDYFWHGVMVVIGIVTIYVVLLFLLGPLIPMFIRATSKQHSLLVACLLISGVGTAINFVAMFLREFCSSLQRIIIPVFADVVGLLSALVFTVIGLVFLNLGIYALAIGTLFRAIIPLLVNIAYTIILLNSVHERKIWSMAIFRDYLVTSPAVLAAKSTGSFLGQLPVILLTRWSGPEVTVAYSVSMRLLEMLKSFVNHPLAALYASAAHFFGDPQVSPKRKSELFTAIARTFSVVSAGCFSIYILLNEGFIGLWMGSEQYLGRTFIVLAALAMYLQLRNAIYSSFIGALGAIQTSSYLACIERLITASLQVGLIYYFGPLGAVAAICLGMVAFQFTYHRILQNIDRLVAAGLSPLLWAWLPSSVLFGILSNTSSFFAVKSWTIFILIVAAIGIAALGIILTLVPDIRTRSISFFIGFFYKVCGKRESLPQ